MCKVTKFIYFFSRFDENFLRKRPCVESIIKLGIEIASKMKLSLFLTSVFGEFLTYENHKVIRASWSYPIVSREIFEEIQNLKSFDIWAPETPQLIFDTQAIDFLVSEDEAEKVQGKFRKNAVNFEILIENARELIAEQTPIEPRANQLLISKLKPFCCFH